MKRWLTLGFIFSTLVVAGISYAWTNSGTAQIEIIYPSGVYDTSICPTPIKVTVKQQNVNEGVDYGKYYLAEDANGDSKLNPAERAAMVQIFRNIDDINQDTVFAIGFIPDAQLQQNHYYFIIGVGKNIAGNLSSDTTLMDSQLYSGGGSSGILNKAIARFKVTGRR